MDDGLDEDDALGLEGAAALDQGGDVRGEVGELWLGDVGLVQVDEEDAGGLEGGEVLGLVGPVGLGAGEAFPDVAEEPVVAVHIGEVEVAVGVAGWGLGDEQEAGAVGPEAIGGGAALVE